MNDQMGLISSETDDDITVSDGEGPNTPAIVSIVDNCVQTEGHPCNQSPHRIHTQPSFILVTVIPSRLYLYTSCLEVIEHLIYPARDIQEIKPITLYVC